MAVAEKSRDSENSLAENNFQVAKNEIFRRRSQHVSINRI